MLQNATMEHAHLSEFQWFKGPVSYTALKGAKIEYVNHYELFVSNCSFEETRTATRMRKAAAETMPNDVKEIEPRLDNKLDALSKEFQNLTLILQKKETKTQKIPQKVRSYCRQLGHFAIQYTYILAKSLHYTFCCIMVHSKNMCYQNHMVKPKAPIAMEK